MARKKKRIRAPKGSGSVYFDEKRNQIVLKITYKDEFNTSKTKKFYGQSEAICREKAEKFLNSLKLAPDLRTLTIPEFIKSQSENKFIKNLINENTYRRHLYTVRLIEDSPIGNIPISELTETQVNIFLNSLVTKSNSTIKKTYTALNNSFKYAINKGIIELNPLDNPDLKRPKSNTPDREVYAFTVKEQEDFIKALNEYKSIKNRNYYKYQLLISLYTGLRMGEVNALKAEDVDINNGYLHVRRTITYDLSDEAKLGTTTKTYNGKRDVPLTKKAKNVLLEAIENATPNKYGLLFYDNNLDRPIATSLVNSAFTRICNKNKINCNGVHTLRHTFATRCIESEVPAEVLKDWLGHKEIGTTIDTYTNVFNKVHEKNIEKVDLYLETLE